MSMKHGTASCQAITWEVVLQQSLSSNDNILQIIVVMQREAQTSPYFLISTSGSSKLGQASDNGC